MLQLIRYGLIGITSNLTIYFAYLFITHHGIEPKLAMTITYIVGVAISFIGNRNWTFSHQGDGSKSFRNFMITYAIAYMLNFFSMSVAVDYMGIPHYLVQAVNLVVISALLFIAQKYWIFAVNLANEIEPNNANFNARKKQ